MIYLDVQSYSIMPRFRTPRSHGQTLGGVEEPPTQAAVKEEGAGLDEDMDEWDEVTKRTAELKAHTEAGGKGTAKSLDCMGNMEK